MKMLPMLAVLLALACARVAPAATPATAPPPDKAARLFDPVASVLQHPRCLNCHQADFPLQTDAGVRHNQLVVRGKDDHGAPTLQCQACHQGANTADGRVPGVPNWHLAPRSMLWQGLSKAQICAELKDPQRNGGRKTAEAVIEHMKLDPLVLWAWNPGAGRTSPPLTHVQFVAALEDWANAGMPCPKATASK